VDTPPGLLPSCHTVHLFVDKLPSVPALQTEYEKLQAQKESLYADYGKLKKQVQEYDVIKRNIDSILQAEK
jgi:hypothetical protein